VRGRDVKLRFTVNGRKVAVDVDPFRRLLDVLREDLGLTGSKEGCGEGECGACTVLVDGAAVNACLAFAVDWDGREVVTIEGLANDPAYDALRQALVDHGGVQCGFCTPGIVVQASALLRDNPAPDEWQIRRGLEGNLCRCTGYRKIIDAVAAAGRQQSANDGEADGR